MTGNEYNNSDEKFDSFLPPKVALRERHPYSKKVVLDLEGILLDDEEAVRILKNNSDTDTTEQTLDSDDFDLEKSAPSTVPVSSCKRFLTTSPKIALYRLVPTNTVFGRTVLFLFTFFTALWLLVWWWGPRNVPVASVIGMLAECERSRRYCGQGQYPRWNGFSDPVPVACPSRDALLPKGVQTYCDSGLLLSHSFAVLVVTQILAVICWAFIWIAFEYLVLGIKNPYAPAKVITRHKPIDEFHKNINHPYLWYQALRRYNESVEKRARIVKSGTFWRFVYNTANLVFLTVLYTFVATSFSVWYWLRPSRGIVCRLMIPFLVSTFIQIFCDQEAIPKIIQAIKQHFKQDDNSMKNVSLKEEALLKAENSCREEQDWESQCCMFIACHMSASSESEAGQLRRTLEAALAHFPPNQIFVCDNANADAPPDKTESLVAKIHPDINYLFIPVGNKSHAFYWTEKIWLPHLQKNGIVSPQASTYILMIDDDVRLPANFSIPTQRLSADSNIVAVQYPVVASDEEEHAVNGKPLLVGLQDIEYAAHHKIPETEAPFPVKGVGEFIRWCPPVYCSGALSVWRREDLRQVLQQHDCVFDGEDQQMGLILLAQRSRKRMIVCDDATITIPTTAPVTIGDFLRQRIKSWDMIAIFWGPSFYFRHALEATYHGIIWGHKPSLKASLWFFRNGVATLFAFNPHQFFARILVLWWYISGSVQESLIGSTTFLVLAPFLLSYLNPFLSYAFCARYTPSWRLPTMRELAVWPFFSFFYSVTNFLSCIYNLTAYGHAVKPPTMLSREFLGDIPPCPPVVHPDWNTVWKL